MKSECWNCGRVEGFEDFDDFVDEGWCRIGVGSPGRYGSGGYGSLSSGSKRDFCFNCRDLIDVLDQVDLMQARV